MTNWGNIDTRSFMCWPWNMISRLEKRKDALSKAIKADLPWKKGFFLCREREVHRNSILQHTDSNKSTTI